jgi:IS5 family transposase
LYLSAIAHARKIHEENYGKESGNLSERKGSNLSERYRKKHAAVESAINALENHGLGRCLDLGIEGFKRYVGLAVLARNIQLIGALLRYHELQKYGMAA